jgi:hypothetical protein
VHINHVTERRERILDVLSPRIERHVSHEHRHARQISRVRRFPRLFPAFVSSRCFLPFRIPGVITAGVSSRSSWVILVNHAFFILHRGAFFFFFFSRHVDWFD